MNQEPQFLARKDLQQLLDQLHAAGYDCIGPTVRQHAIVFDRIENINQLPEGIIDEQAPGRYMLHHTDAPTFFQWTTGPQAIKPYLFKPQETLWTAEKTSDGALRFESYTPPARKLAILGIRACDLAALYIHDKHFLHDQAKDPGYLANRQHLFLIGINCTRSAATCFCNSTGDGPQLTYGYDLGMTELADGFLIDALSQAGNEMLAKLPTQPSSDDQIEAAATGIATAAKQQRKLPSNNLREALFNNLEHPHWQTVAQRCLSCGNCTAVCPTCFCHNEADEVNLDGTQTAHIRQWDSCFTPNHSYIHGITIRAQTSQRYRQWLTHKLGSWHDQFGRSGCVGCGRCISWCPVGIDLTEEVTQICGTNT